MRVGWRCVRREAQPSLCGRFEIRVEIKSRERRMRYQRMPIEIESPEELGYDTIKYNLSESSMRDRKLSDLGLAWGDLLLAYGPHRGEPRLRRVIAAQAGGGLKESDVLTTAGAAGALFIIAT